jgi:molecular chaperone GrpE
VSDKAKPTTESPPENGTQAEAGMNEKDTVTLSSREVEELRKQAAEAQEYLDLARRTQAEFQNYQKRMQREREQERDFARSAYVLELVPVLDNLERALKAARDAGETGSLVQGVSMVQAQFLEMLKRLGVTPIAALGEPFDPSVHEALVQQPSKDHPPNTVMHVEQAGYKMNERVIRPAKVVVSAPVS